MSEQHPITPPPELMPSLELLHKWITEAAERCRRAGSDVVPAELYELCIAFRAATWGANERTQTICGWLDEPSQKADHLMSPLLEHFYPLPKPPSLAEEARTALNSPGIYVTAEVDTVIRRALERLQELEGGNG